jgi:transposase-like protein
MPMQSNLAIAEELLRITRYLEPGDEPSCPNVECPCYQKWMSAAPTNYVKFGQTKGGTPRYRCQTCRKVFSHGGKATKRQRRTHNNLDVLKHLVNRVPLSRISAILDMPAPTLYRKIDFIWQQCRAFVGVRERKLLNMSPPDIGKRYISVDRQMLSVNWATRKDRRNVLLWGIGSADLDSGYVFGMHLNYDPDMNETEVQRDMLRFGDDHLKQPFRRYARVWLPADYEAAAAYRRRIKRRKASQLTGEDDELTAEIMQAYDEAQRRPDIEAGPAPSQSLRTPAEGMLVHEQVTMNAHMQYLARLLRNAEKVRVFMDQESGLRAAFMSAFWERLKAPERTADAFYVSILKEMTVNQKRREVMMSDRRFNAAMLAHPELSQDAIMVMLVREEMEKMTTVGRWDDPWLSHPLPNLCEPIKKVCWLTDLAGYSKDHIARLYLKATLHPIDRYFMQVRRRISLAERGITSASNQGRVWFGYNAYDPNVLVKMLEIFRVFYNYCEDDTSDKQTPAVRLGLAEARIDPQDILYFERPPG